MKKPEHSPEPKELLEAFVASGRSEEAFGTLVDNLSRLVYSSALRRTGDRYLAEEITQNVFAILARKAEGLCRHPALEAWILKTTRLQAANAMRAKQRRQRKIASLASEAEADHPNALHPMEDTASWKDAVPHLDEALDRLADKDQKIIVQRFYQGKKFREIAAANGQTEGACKKRVERALQKLSRMLSARGVTLSATVVASTLGTEMARSAPAQTAAALVPEALAASSTVPTITLITNTVQTMSKLKTTTITAAAVLIVAAVPYTQQRVEAGRIESELQALQDQRSARQTEPDGKLTALGKQDRLGQLKPANPRTAGAMLESMEGPVGHRVLIRKMIVALGSRDTLTNEAVRSRLQRMSLEERKDLLRALKTFPIVGNAKDDLATQILSSALDLSLREKLEELLVFGSAIGGQSYMREWSASDPDAAMEWFWKKRTSGELDRGLGDGNFSFYDWTLSDLLNGLAKEHPAKALNFYRKLPREEIEEHDLRSIGGTIARGEIERGEQTYFRRMLDTHEGEDRKAILVGILSAHVGEGFFDEGMAIVDDYVESPEERDEYIESIFETTGLPFWKIGTGFDWLVASSPVEEAPAVLRRMTKTASFTSGPSTLEWVDRQEPGVIRDHGYAGWIEGQLRSTFADDFPRVLPAAEKIGDPALRSEIQQLIRTKWDEQDQEKVSPDIPAEVLEKLESL